jgi:hypothetical protein
MSWIAGGIAQISTVTDRDGLAFEQ